MNDIDHDSKEEIEKRKSQEDPIVMYLIVRESLQMSVGKIAAQCAHASLMVYLDYQKQCSNYSTFGENEEEFKRRVNMTAWLNSSFRKVVLRADDREFAKLEANLPGDSFVTVIDAGLTQLQPNTKTVIGVYPMYKSEAPKIIKKLQVL